MNRNHCWRTKRTTRNFPTRISAHARDTPVFWGINQWFPLPLHWNNHNCLPLLFYGLTMEKTRTGGHGDSWNKPLLIPSLAQNHQALLFKKTSKKIIPNSGSLSPTTRSVCSLPVSPTPPWYHFTLLADSIIPSLHFRGSLCNRNMKQFRLRFISLKLKQSVRILTGPHILHSRQKPPFLAPRANSGAQDLHSTMEISV